jgi:hypothetical protein
MAITTYAELQTAVADHMARSDLTAYIPDFIVLAENVLNFGMKSEEYDLEPLRVRDMETVSSLTPTAGVVTLPSTFLEPRRVVEEASIRRPLEYITPETVDYFYPTRPSGQADHYTIIGSSLYMFPLSANDIEVHHYRTIPPLASNDPNWLLTKNANIYLRGSLMQAAIFVKDDAEALKQGVILKALVSGMNAADARANYKGAGVYLAGPTP